MRILNGENRFMRAIGRPCCKSLVATETPKCAISSMDNTWEGGSWSTALLLASGGYRIPARKIIGVRAFSLGESLHNSSTDKNYRINVQAKVNLLLPGVSVIIEID